MASRQNRKPNILMVMNGPPWSSWTMSGVSAGICQELLNKQLLYGAISHRCLTNKNFRRPSRFYRLREVFENLVSMVKTETQVAWDSESCPRLASLLQDLPESTPVVYTYVNIAHDKRYKLRRFRWVGMSVVDAVRWESYGHKGMSAKEFRDKFSEQRDGIHSSEAIFTHSSYGADAIARDFNFPRDKIYPIGAGASLQFEGEVCNSNERYRKANILFVGRDWERKGGPLVYEAFLLLKNTLPHATLTIVGPKTQPVFGDGIIFEGFLRKHRYFEGRRLKRLFEKASLFCTPSICETWGLVYVEAAACGLPIVGTQEWAMPDIVINGKTGILCPERSPQELAAAMNNILSQPSKALNMGNAAIEHVRDVLDWPNVVDRMMAAIRPEALGGREPTWLPGDHHRLNRQQEVNTE